MIILRNGREIDVPTDEDGYASVPTLRRAAAVPPSRMLMSMEPSGSNTILPSTGLVKIHPYAHFMEAPIHERGQRS